ELIHDGKRTALMVGTVGGLVGLVAPCLADEARFAPAATLTAFIGAAVLIRRAPSAIFPWRAVRLAIASALISLTVGGALGARLCPAGPFSGRARRHPIAHPLPALRGGSHCRRAHRAIAQRATRITAPIRRSTSPPRSPVRSTWARPRESRHSGA